MSRVLMRCLPMLGVVLLTVLMTSPRIARAADPPARPMPTDTGASPGLGVDPAELSWAVTHPLLMYSSLKKAVYVGKERDGETGQSFKVRLELTARDTAETIAGVKVTTIDVTDFADDEVVERARMFYAQHRSGAVYWLGELVDDYEDGKVIGHEGQWQAGENAQAGMLMPAAPKMGDVYEPERAPGISQTRSKVVALSRTVKVPAGTFKDCIEVDVFDALEKTSAKRWYCPGAGLVKETGTDRVLELASRVNR